MMRWLRIGAVLACGLMAAQAEGQESQAAKATRKKLQQKVTIEIKEAGTRAFLDELNTELDTPLKFKIDNASGVSNNSKMSYKAKNVTVEKILNDLSDKYDFGWVVISNASNNAVDGSVLIRKGKGKERGYEAGKEPQSFRHPDAYEAGKEPQSFRHPDVRFPDRRDALLGSGAPDTHADGGRKGFECGEYSNVPLTDTSVAARRVAATCLSA